MGTSLQEIAQKAKVAPSTVSRALSDRESVRGNLSQETVVRIRSLAEKMGYVMNANARGLKARLTKLIGIIVTSDRDPFWSRIIEAATNEAAEMGWSTLLAYSGNAPRDEIEVIKTFQGRRVDGIVVAASGVGKDSKEHIQQLLQCDAPIVLVNRQGQGMYDGFHYVGVDDQRGAEMATRHLIQKGHESIAYFGLKDREHSNYRRERGYLRALEDARIVHAEALIYTGRLGEGLPMEDGIAVGKELVRQIEGELKRGAITAIFCFNDVLAIGALLQCQALGINVPAQCSIVGFDGLPMTTITTPPLTTIKQPREQIGRHAIRLLLSIVGSEDERVVEHLGGKVYKDEPFMEPEFMVGASTEVRFDRYSASA